MAHEQILIVDDDRTTGKVIELQLSKMGYTVAGLARSGSEAVSHVRRNPPDLVLMDINLGRGMDGIDAAYTIMKQHNTPVVYVTAYSDEVTLERAKQTNPYGYINKPIRVNDLRTTISLALDRAAAMAASAQSGVNDPDLWRVHITCNSYGLVGTLDEGTRDALARIGVQNIDELLPPEHKQHVQDCVNGGEAQLATGKVGDRILSWEYRSGGKNSSTISMTITDITEHKRLTDRNIQQASLSEALDRLATGIIFINENLKVFYTNKSADKLVKSSKVLRLKDGHLNCSSAERTAELHRLVLQESVSTMTLTRPQRLPPIQVLVSPLHDHGRNYGHNLPIAMIYVFDSINESERIEEVIRTLYGLSPTESKIAAKLVLTPDVHEVAKSLGITYNTARTHVKRIYAKTKINRLPSLVHMIVTGPAGLLIQSRD